MVDDPNNRRNLVRKEPEVVRKMQKAIDAFLRGQGLEGEYMAGYRRQ